MKRIFILLMFFAFSVSLVKGQDSDLLNQIKELKTPLLIHTNTNDDDVHVLEVETLIRALKAVDKKFEYEIFKDIPGGHSFDRIDPKQSREIRLRIWTFLAKYLNPPTPMKTLKDMEHAAYVVVK